MVVTQYPGELGVAYSPTQRYPGTTQSQQTFQGLPQPEPESLMASKGFQNLKHVVQGTVENRTAHATGVPESKQRRSCPLLNSLLKGNPSNFTSFYKTPSLLSKNINADKLNTSTYFSDERHCKKRRGRSSPAALNCGKTKAQNQDNSEGAHFTPCQKQFASPFLNNQPSAEKVLSVAEMAPPTDDQIQGFIAEKVAYFRTFLLKNKHHGHAYTNRDRNLSSNDMDSTFQYNYITPKPDGSAHLITNSAFDHKREKKSLSCAVTEQCNAAVGQRGLTELTSKSETDDCATSASNQCSSGTLASAEGNSEHALKTESLEKIASLDFELPDTKHLDVTMSSNGSDKPVYLGEGRTFISNNDENFHSKLCNKYLQNGVTTLHYSLTALKELIASLENVETITEMDNFPKVILQQFWDGDTDNIHLFASTEYPQIMGNVAATCMKNEDESPKVLTAVPAMTWNELTEKQHNSSFNCSPSKDECKFPWLHINQNLDDTDHIHNVSQALKHITEMEKGDKGLVSMQGVTDVAKDLQTETSSVAYGSRTFEVSANSNLNLSTDKIQVYNVESALPKENKQLFNQTICEDSKGSVHSLPSQIDANIALSINKFKEQFPFSESKSKEEFPVSTLKDLQYEDISDDENMPQMATTVSTKGNEKLCLPPSFEDQQYEVISKDENSQLESVCVKRPSPTQVLELKNKQPRVENESHGHVQRQVQMKTELISDEEVIPKPQISPETETLGMAQHCSCSHFVETDDGLICSKCERPFGSQPNYSVLEVEDENDDQMDDDNQMDNDWIVIPISISDLKFEPKDENQECTDDVYLKDNETGNKEENCDTISLSVPAASTIEVFETVEKFRQAKALQSKINIFEVALDLSTPQCELDSEEELNPLKNSRELCSESEDSCETEDSRDYSPEPERHYLTVSKQLLQKSPEPLPPKTDDSLSEKEGQDEVMDVQKGRTKRFGTLCFQNLKQLIKAKAASNCAAKKTNGQNISNKDDIIILDSDTENESVQNCQKKRKRKRLVSSDSDSSGTASCKQQKRYSPETVDSMCRTVKQKHKTVRLPSADLTASQHQSKFHYTQCKEVMDTCSEMSHSTEMTKQLTKSGSENVQYDQTVIILDSDTDDYNDQNYKKAKKKRWFSAGSSDVDNAPCAQQKRCSPETLDSKFGTVKEKHTDIRLSSSSSLPLHKPKFHDSQSEEVMQDACSYQAHKPVKSGQPTKGQGDSEQVQLISNEREDTKIILSSASEDSDDALFTTKNRPITETENHLRGTGNKRTGNPRSSDKSPKKQLQSMGNEVDPIMDPSPLNPHVVQRSSHPAETVKLVKKSILHSDDKTSPKKTLTETSKNTDSCEKIMQHLHRDRRGRFTSKLKRANSGHHSIKNVIKANKKPIQVSRQLSSPSQEVHFTSSSSSSPSGQFSDARQSLASSRDLSNSGKTSASCSLSQSNQNVVVPRQNMSSKPRLSHSNSSPSTLDHPSSPTKDPSSLTKQSSARQAIKAVWKNSYFNTRKDRRSDLEMEKNLRTTNNDLCKEARPAPSHHDRASRKRHNSHESETPLMKRTKFDAIQWTKAINRDTSSKERSSVGEGYKWSEKPTVAKSTKGSSRLERK